MFSESFVVVVMLDAWPNVATNWTKHERYSYLSLTYGLTIADGRELDRLIAVVFAQEIAEVFSGHLGAEAKGRWVGIVSRQGNRGVLAGLLGSNIALHFSDILSTFSSALEIVYSVITKVNLPYYLTVQV